MVERGKALRRLTTVKSNDMSEDFGVRVVIEKYGELARRKYIAVNKTKVHPRPQVRYAHTISSTRYDSQGKLNKFDVNRQYVDISALKSDLEKLGVNVQERNAPGTYGNLIGEIELRYPKHETNQLASSTICRRCRTVYPRGASVFWRNGEAVCPHCGAKLLR